MKHAFRRFVLNRWKLYVVAIVFGGPIVWLIAAYPPANAAEVASWVQGVGTVFAVLAAAWVARDQFDWQQQAQVSQANSRQLAELSAIAETLTLLNAEAVAGFAACEVKGSVENASFFETKFDLQHLLMLERLIKALPFALTVSAPLAVALYKARDFAEGLRGHMESFRDESSGALGFHERDHHLESLKACRDGIADALRAFEAEIEAVGAR